MDTIEIEYKTLLSSENYEKLWGRFVKDSTESFEQTNYYFDTENHQLAKQHSGLRIRITATKAELTLKTPTGAKNSLLETTEKLSLTQASDYLAKNQIPLEGPVGQKIAALGIDPAKIILIGQLKTKRVEIPLREGNLLVLDESWYNGHHDFELEMETQDEENGQSFFINFLAHYEIPYHSVPNKVQRMMQTLK